MNFLLEAIKLLCRGCPSGLQTQHSFLVDTNASYIIGVKGQIMLESIYEIMDFRKYHKIFLIDFCPERFYRLGACDLF